MQESFLIGKKKCFNIFLSEMLNNNGRGCYGIIYNSMKRK